MISSFSLSPFYYRYCEEKFRSWSLLGVKKVNLTIIRVHHDSRRYHKAEERLRTKTRIRKYKSRRKLCKVMITRRPRAFNSSKSETPLLAPSRIATKFSWRNYLHIRTCKFSSIHSGMSKPLASYSRETRLKCRHGFYLKVTESGVEGSRDSDDRYSK